MLPGGRRQRAVPVYVPGEVHYARNGEEARDCSNQLAARNPSAHRSLIAFTAWSSFAHAVVMGSQVYEKIVGRVELMGVGLLIVIGIVLVALAPAKKKAGSSPESQNPRSSGA